MATNNYQIAGYLFAFSACLSWSSQDLLATDHGPDDAVRLPLVTYRGTPYGADVTRRPNAGTLPLFVAAGTNSHDGTECVRLILSGGADPTLRTAPTSESPNGKSALDIATETGSVDSILLLLPPSALRAGQ